LLPFYKQPRGPLRRSKESPTMKLRTENIYQVILLKASPAQVFDALIDQDEHTSFTGKEAFIQPHEGGSLTICNGNQSGWITRLVKNKRIVLALTHKRFPAGHFSVVDIRLSREESGNTKLELNHIGVPEEAAGWATEAWKKVHWKPLSSHLQTKTQHAQTPA
jgi:activator of HSP90 ATPase